SDGRSDRSRRRRSRRTRRGPRSPVRGLPPLPAASTAPRGIAILLALSGHVRTRHQKRSTPVRSPPSPRPSRRLPRGCTADRRPSPSGDSSGRPSGQCQDSSQTRERTARTLQANRAEEPGRHRNVDASPPRRRLTNASIEAQQIWRLRMNALAHASETSASYVTTADGVQLYYKDWGPRTGEPVVLSHGWPLSSDSWESQMLFLADNGYRVVAHDRRGHGRSSQPWEGNDMDHYADDLAAVIETLDLRDVTLIGFSTGGGEAARYIGRHGTGRVKKVALVSAVTPLMVKRADNPKGVPIEVFDGIRKAALENRSQLYLDIASGPFFGFNRPGAKAS